MERVEEVIKDLRLTKCQNTKIGGTLIKGISGGERKRTAIGVELIMDPQLIFLDEPTTGLDSYTAASVMETLRALSASGRTVISSIHQPNSEIFNNFDRLMLIANGKLLFMNEAALSSDYFAKIGYVCPAMSNPADYFMTVMSMENPNDENYDSDGSTSVSKKIKTEADILREYNKKIDQLYLCYQESDLKNDYAFESKDTVPIHPTEIHVSHTNWF
jgi:ABC-type multidrug transport system ATPase subunit